MTYEPMYVFSADTKCKSHGINSFGLFDYHCRDIARNEAKCIGIFPRQVPKFWAIGFELCQYFSNALIGILYTNGWRQPFEKLPILELSLHNSAAFCLWQKFLWDLPEYVTFNIINLHLPYSWIQGGGPPKGFFFVDFIYLQKC